MWFSLSAILNLISRKSGSSYIASGVTWDIGNFRHRFLAKTDSGLRRLFSEEVWSWGKEKKGGEAGLTEPDVLQGVRSTQTGYPKTSPRCSRKHCKSEETLKGKEGTPRQKHRPMKTMDNSAEAGEGKTLCLTYRLGYWVRL